MLIDIYEGSIYRPPSEAFSLILQATIGCSWNRCTFCVAFKDKQFRTRTLDEIKLDVEKVFPMYANVQRIFLADGNALCMPVDELENIIKYLYSKFKLLQRVSIYGGPLDLEKINVDELERLKRAGLELVYFGLESGSDRVLGAVKKGATPRNMVEAADKIKKAGLKLSVIFILGLGGKELTEIHAVETARIINAQDPDYAAALTLMVEPTSGIRKDVSSGRLTLLDPDEVLMELYTIVERMNVSHTLFRANHASNYAPIGGTLPGDKEKILAQIQKALRNKRYKPEMFRAL